MGVIRGKSLSVVVACILFFILISCQSNLIKNGSNQDRISVSNAEKLVHEWAFTTTPDMNPKAEFRLEEITTDEIWQRLHIQLFRLPDDHFLGRQVFIIRKEQVEPMGCTFGGVGITHMLITDLDSNGEPELTYTDSCGSGMQRSHIAIYIPNNYTYTQIYADLTLFMGEFIVEKTDDQTVFVKAGSYDYRNDKFISGAKVGILKIMKQDNQIKLIVELEDNIPVEILKNLSTTIK